MRQDEVQIFNLNAEKLSEHLDSASFARIEVSNIADSGYLGIGRTLSRLGSLLQAPAENPHATLITLFMNAVGEMITPEEDKMIGRHEMEQLRKFMPLSNILHPPFDPCMVVAYLSRAIVRDMDKYFDRYMKRHGFEKAPQDFYLATKSKNTVVEKWPLRLKLRSHQQGAQEEFETLLCSSHGAFERYVGWQRTE